MTAAPDTRVPPLAPGTLCTLDGAVVRVYARIWPGELWDGKYDCRPVGRTEPRRFATREQLEVCRG